MKLRPTLLSLATVLGCLMALPTVSPAQEKGDKPLKLDKSTTDKAKQMFDKLVGEAKEAVKEGGEKGKDLWERTKENFTMSREDYIKKVNSGLATMDAEIQALVESGGAVVSRDYFKTRIESLKQQLDYCKRDLARLQEAPTDEAFRVKQRGFDRGLDFLGENIELAKEEAGL
jgi:polyhydroxyalkanoate synthesis regulator phasin